MALGAFEDKTHQPTDDEIANVIGRSHHQWHTLLQHLEATYTPLVATWNFGGAKYGWSLRLAQNKRSVVYLMPCHKHFLASTAFGEKACRAARMGGLAESTLELIEAAPKFAEGRAVRFPVRTKHDREQVEKLLAIKMSI